MLGWWASYELGDMLQLSSISTLYLSLGLRSPGLLGTAPSDSRQWLQISQMIISSQLSLLPLTVSSPALEHHVLSVWGDGPPGGLGAPVRSAGDHVQEDAAVLRH